MKRPRRRPRNRKWLYFRGHDLSARRGATAVGAAPSPAAVPQCPHCGVPLLGFFDHDDMEVPDYGSFKDEDSAADLGPPDCPGCGVPLTRMFGIEEGDIPSGLDGLHCWVCGYKVDLAWVDDMMSGL